VNVALFISSEVKKGSQQDPTVTACSTCALVLAQLVSTVSNGSYISFTSYYMLIELSLSKLYISCK